METQEKENKEKCLKNKSKELHNVCVSIFLSVIYVCVDLSVLCSHKNMRQEELCNCGNTFKITPHN